MNSKTYVRIALILLVITFTLTVVFSPPALAHHEVIDGGTTPQNEAGAPTNAAQGAWGGETRYICKQGNTTFLVKTCLSPEGDYPLH